MASRANGPQYQSFPETPGDSASLRKLKSLRLPSLVGQHFLDIGCNEGFFCGYAQFAGATRIVGIDASALFIERARKRFAGIEFLHQAWDTLPAGPFDVILIASALHYAADQEDLIRRAVALLSPKGTLVLELGVAHGEQSIWSEVNRGADTRFFPTWGKLHEILLPYSWKIIGNSETQKGDPVPRYTLHINIRKPIAYLVMQPPGFGKTTICKELFTKAGVPIISGDRCLADIASGRMQTDPALQNLVRSKFSTDAADKTTAAIITAGLLPELVQAWLTQAEGSTFALDSFVPKGHHEQVEGMITASGFLAVKLAWERPGAELHAMGKVQDLADAYFAELASTASTPHMPFQGTLGAIVQLGINSKIIDITGWAVHEDGRMPNCIAIRLGDTVHFSHVYERISRPQIQARLGLPHAMYGFKITIPIPKNIAPTEVLDLLQVYGGGTASQMYGPFSKELLKSTK